MSCSDFIPGFIPGFMPGFILRLLSFLFICLLARLLVCLFVFFCLFAIAFLRVHAGSGRDGRRQGAISGIVIRMCFSLHANIHKYSNSTYNLEWLPVVGGWRWWLSVKKYVRSHGGFMPVSRPVVQFMMVCHPNGMNGHVFLGISILTLLSFGEKIGGPTKKKKKEEQKTKKEK